METNTTNTEQKARVCPKDCRRCTFHQQVFCASQMSFNAFEVMNEILKRIDELGAKVQKLQGSEELLDPAHE